MHTCPRCKNWVSDPNGAIPRIVSGFLTNEQTETMLLAVEQGPGAVDEFDPRILDKLCPVCLINVMAEVV